MGLKDKASRINFGGLGASKAAPGDPANPGAADVKPPKTAPGMMMAHAGAQRSAILIANETLQAQVNDLTVQAARASELQEELAAWDNAKATRLIDPRHISRSRWANRDPRSFESASFVELKNEIANAGGNVQPIKVRPTTVGSDGLQEYELVFGHRRHEACLQLGLPVLALVDNLGDAALFVEMDRENRSRKDLSAWEQGVMYQRALREGLFPSNRRLSDAVGVALSTVGKTLGLASLPDFVVAAFESPLDLQIRWSKPLRDAYEANPSKVKACALKLAQRSPRLKARDVFGQLVASATGGGETVSPPSQLDVIVKGKKAASISISTTGSASVTIPKESFDASRMAELALLLEKFLGSKRRP